MEILQRKGGRFQKGINKNMGTTSRVLQSFWSHVWTPHATSRKFRKIFERMTLDRPYKSYRLMSTELVLRLACCCGCWRRGAQIKFCFIETLATFDQP